MLALSTSVLPPVFERAPLPERTPPIVILPAAALIVPVEDPVNAIARLIAWAVEELLMISPKTVSAVPPLAPDDPALAASV